MTKPQLQPGASGHNDVCPCGSQKKYEKCCGKAAKFSAAMQAALQACEAENWQQAQTSCEQALRLEPNHADALQLRVTIALQRRDHKTALTYLRRAIQQSPQSSTLYNILGTIQLELQRINEAEQSYKTAIQLDSDNAKAHHKLGDIWHSQGKLAEAQQAYREALRCQPNFPEVHNNLGQLLLSVHQYDQAIVHLVRAIELRPEQHKTYHLLALALQEQGRYQQAQAVLEQVIRLKPDYAEAWHELGVSLLGQRRLSEGIAALEKSVQLDPKLVQGYLNLGGLHYEHGLADIAREYFRRAQAILPSDALHIKTALCLPAVYESAAQVQAERERLTAELKHLANKKLRLTDPLNEVALTPFYLAYQGENEVEMLSRIGDLFLKTCPTLGQVAPHCLTPKRGGEPLKIGFLSSSFARENHIVNRVMSGVIANWPRDRFQVTLLHPNAPCNEIRLMLRDGDRLLHVPNALEAARQQIAAAQFDILFYCDLGMEPWTYFL
ncbi:MAG: tetratricopeptide repeat protein, partial [Acidobacteria bacterium]|nr:tetratricopeptide repeat protein [Acidobacteriota bacterium]